ncbi:hypothetical protein GCM10027456_31040 [Kineosporia babensis]
MAPTATMTATQAQTETSKNAPFVQPPPSHRAAQLDESLPGPRGTWLRRRGPDDQARNDDDAIARVLPFELRPGFMKHRSVARGEQEVTPCHFRASSDAWP